MGTLTSPWTTGACCEAFVAWCSSFAAEGSGRPATLGSGTRAAATLLGFVQVGCPGRCGGIVTRARVSNALGSCTYWGEVWGQFFNRTHHKIKKKFTSYSAMLILYTVAGVIHVTRGSCGGCGGGSGDGGGDSGDGGGGVRWEFRKNLMQYLYSIFRIRLSCLKLGRGRKIHWLWPTSKTMTPTSKKILISSILPGMPSDSELNLPFFINRCVLRVHRISRSSKWKIGLWWKPVLASHRFVSLQSSKKTLTTLRLWKEDVIRRGTPCHVHLQLTMSFIPAFWLWIKFPNSFLSSILGKLAQDPWWWIPSLTSSPIWSGG